MNISLTPEAEKPPVHPTSGWGIEWEKAVEYLIANDYEQVVILLKKRQATAAKYDDNKLVALLEAAIQICQACIQHQSQVELHSQAMTQSLQRQQQLQQQMLAFLNSTVNSATSANGRVLHGETNGLKRPSPITTKPEDSDELSNLWHNLRTVSSEATQPESSPKPTLSVYCLGAFRVFVNGRPITNWSGNKCKSIFKHMIMNRHRPVNHEVLMDLFWPEDEPEVARRNLYQAIYLLRQALQQERDDNFQYIHCHDGTYSFNPRLDIWVDSALFEEQYTQGLQLEREARQEEAVKAFEAADNLYSGDFLAEDVYEEWATVHRERIKHSYLDMLDRISQHYWSTKQLPQCVTYCQKILQGDNCREDIHRRLMLAYFYQGQRHLAIRQYHHCVQVLSQELEVEPMPATTKLYEQIISGEQPTL